MLRFSRQCNQRWAMEQDEIDALWLESINDPKIPKGILVLVHGCSTVQPERTDVFCFILKKHLH